MTTSRPAPGTPATARPTPTALARRARGAVFALFFTNGALFANLVPRYPEVKDTFGLSDPAYGATIALFPLGAVCAGPLAAWVIRRFSSARAATLGTTAIGIALSLVGMVTVWRASIDEGGSGPSTLAYVLFAVTFFLGGGADSITDVGQNAHGLRVQRLYGRSIINSFHGGWSLGAVTGGLMGSAAVGLGIPLGWHLLGAAVIFIVVGMVALRFALPGADGPGAGESGAPGAGDAPVEVGSGPAATRNWPWLAVILALTVLSISGTAVEDVTSTWSTLYMRDFLGVEPGFAGLAFVTMLVSQAVGRLGGDRVIDALGMRRTIQLGGVLVLVGTGLAAIVPAVWTMMVAMVLTGVGCAAVVPVAMNAADDVPGLRPGVGLTVVTWLMRLSFLLGPPLVGLLVEATSLRAAIMVMPVAGAVTLFSAVVLNPRARAGQ